MLKDRGPSEPDFSNSKGRMPEGIHAKLQEDEEHHPRSPSQTPTTEGPLRGRYPTEAFLSASAGGATKGSGILSSLPPTAPTASTTVAEMPSSHVASHAFVVHSIHAVDPLIGELFVCPDTLEALCLHRMLNLPVAFTWERFPAPCPFTAHTKQLWWLLESSGPSLPAAVHPKTGRLLSGCKLMEVLRKACAHSAGLGEGALGVAAAPINSLDPVGCSESGWEANGGPLEHPLCIGTFDGRSSGAVERATQLAVTQLVQQAVQTALRFYMWRDEATFSGFTRPLFLNSLGFAYGNYYCWAMRRSMRHPVVSRSSPQVYPEDLTSPFPKVVNAGSSQGTVTVEELLVIDGVGRALRVVEQLLQGRLFFGGSKTGVVDAVVFAHLAILFSLPLPDRKELQTVISNRGALLQYCCRVQEAHQIWPAGPSFLFGVSSLARLVTTDTVLRVHSWRQRYGDSDEGGAEGRAPQFLWWLGAAACCAALLVAAGKTPLRFAKVSSQGNRRLLPRAGSQAE